MARVTVEDCLQVIPNRFSLVLIAAERTKQILNGAQPQISNEDENKEAVVALREIAGRKFSIDDSAVNKESRWLPKLTGDNHNDSELPPEME
ncbi:MAG: DNA-directed RNA polymerase subunit omega [Deltaproteobacteria bacterium]|nr:DNA-directed RNA polymerase subunit omega [Deltaproteobacteria bacterium]